MSSKWDENTTLKFVLEYKKHACLWDCKSALYKNKNSRERAYKDIAGTMAIAGFNVPEVKNKIKNLRSTYCQELKKISMRSRSSPEDAYTPGLKWFKEMDSVLGSIQASRITTASAVKIDTEDTSDGYLELSDTIVQPVLLHRNDDDVINLQPQTLPKRSRPRPSEPSSTITTTTPTRPSGFQSAGIDDEEFEAFGKYISLQLRKLSTERAIRAKEYIHTYLTEQRLEELHDAPLVARTYSLRQTISGLPYSRSPSHVTKSASNPIETIEIPHFDFKSEYNFSDSS